MKKAEKKLLILIIVVLIAVVAVMSVLLIRQQSATPDAGGVIYDPNQSVSGGKQEIDSASPPGVTIPGWTEIRLPAKSKEAKVALHNPKENAKYYDLTFTLKLADTGEVIFATGLIPPGYQCDKVMLTRKLEKGAYEAVLLVQPHQRNENQTATNNAELEMTLIVE